MRCPRCEFENMPGLTACIRCGSVLCAEEPIDVDPPRAKGWQKRLRPLGRTWRRIGVPIPSARDVLPQGVWPTLSESGLGEALIDFFLGLVPGLLYLMRRRYRAFLIGGGTFLALLLGAIFFYGSWLGNLCAGLAVGAHVIMFLHSTGITRGTQFGPRLLVSLLVVLAFSTLDRRVGRMVTQDFVGAYTTMSIPAHRIENGDFLLAHRRLRDRPNPLPRGTVVQARLPTLIAPYQERLRIGGYTVLTFGQVVGRPGETVSIVGDRFQVDDHLLESDAYPLPDWLASQEITVTVPAGTYFINTRYQNPYRRELAIEEDLLRQLVLVPFSSVEARAIMRWQPLRRRGFLRTLP